MTFLIIQYFFPAKSTICISDLTTKVLKSFLILIAILIEVTICDLDESGFVLVFSTCLDLHAEFYSCDI